MIFRSQLVHLVFLSAALTACGPEKVPLALQSVPAGAGFEAADNGTEPNVTFLQAIIQQGIPLKLAKAAVLKYDRFSEQVLNTEYLAMVDMTQHSGKKRFFLVHRATGKVEAFPVAHGAGSDPTDSGYANYFSNVPDSHMSSLGSYLVQEKYKGKYGESLKLDGLERSNSNARHRTIVLHPSNYVKEGSKKQGRSWGCPAIPYPWIKKVIERMANGAFMYVYGVNKRDTRGDDFWVQKWNLIPKAQWTNESEDAPVDGE